MTLGVVAVGIMGQTAHATPSPSDAEVDFLQKLNNERNSRGLVALARDPGLDAVADDWSAQMANVNVLSHRPDLATRIAAVEPKWARGGENVGYGGDVLGLHNAFMNSPGHYANVVGDWNRIGVGVVIKGSTIWVTFNFLKGPPLATTTSASASGAGASFSDPGKVWVVTDNGQVHSLGGAPFYGDLRDLTLVKPIVGMTPTPSGLGYWMVASDGGIFAFGDALFYGSTGGAKLVAPIVAMTSTPTGKGYWLVASDGGVFAFGDARFLGSLGGMRLNEPINGISATASGKGYWMVASDGGMFAFGDADFYGSLGGHTLAAAVQGVATSPNGKGYWLVEANGAVHAFGDAVDHGSADAAGVPLSRIAPTRDGQGYRMAAADGRVFLFGSAGAGNSAPLGLTRPIVALASAA